MQSHKNSNAFFLAFIFLSSLFISLISNASGAPIVPVKQYAVRYTSSSIISPTGYGLGWGQVGFGVGYVNHWPNEHGEDGYGTVSMGFGNPHYVGLTVSALMDSVGINEEFGKHGTIGVKLNHESEDGIYAIAIGAANAVPWNALKHQAVSYYAVGTYTFNVSGDPTDRLDLVASLGVGSGAFHSVKAFQEDKESVRPFASLALKVIPQAAIIANYAANHLAAGVSVAPFQRFPLVLGASILNLTGPGNDSLTYLLTAAVGFSFI